MAISISCDEYLSNIYNFAHNSSKANIKIMADGIVLQWMPMFINFFRINNIKINEILALEAKCQPN